MLISGEILLIISFKNLILTPLLKNLSNRNFLVFLFPYTWQKNCKKGLFRSYIQTLPFSYKGRKTDRLIDPSYALERALPFAYFESWDCRKTCHRRDMETYIQ